MAYGASRRKPNLQPLAAEVGELPTRLPDRRMELPSHRTAHSTRYLNPDGTFTEEIFLEPQFYRDETGDRWLPIDNNVQFDSSRGRLENTANQFRTSFAQVGNADELVSLQKGGNRLSLRAVNGRDVKPQVNGNLITYEGLFPETDARYLISGGSVKESLVLHRHSQNTYSFEMKLSNLTPQVEQDGTISLTDRQGQRQFSLAKPFMSDANGVYSDQVEMRLREENGKTFLDLIADESFLNDPNTQFPVVIDPTVNNWDVMRDTFISSAYPAASFGSETFMNVGYHGYYGVTRALTRFYLPALPSSSRITSATFHAYQNKWDAATATIDLFPITGDWTTNTTWNSQPPVASAPAASATSSAVNAYWSWDISQLIQQWYDGEMPNYGFLLKARNENTTPYRSFVTVNAGNNTPRLTLNYAVDPIGIEDFWRYTRDGVNPANGNLTLDRTDLSIPGRGVEVNVTRTYNSRNAEEAGLFGYGWASNLGRRIIDSGAGPITYVDEDGTRHHFGERADGLFAAGGGIYLELIKNADGTYTITRPDRRIMRFNAAGRLTAVVDPNGNEKRFDYDTAGRLTTIYDASGRPSQVTHNTMGFIDTITDPAGRVWRYQYDSAGNLTQVTDQAGYVTAMTYDNLHRLLSLTDPRNLTTTYDYDAANRVTAVSLPHDLTGSGGVSLVLTTYAYDTSNNTTSVTDGAGVRTDYQYNANANITQITQNPLDPNNRAVITLRYDDRNNLVEFTDPNGIAGGTGAYLYAYDAQGDVTGEQLPTQETAYYTYDDATNLMKLQDYKDTVATFDYNAENNQTEAIDPYVQSVAKRYDAYGNLIYFSHPMSTADDLIANSNFERATAAGTWPESWTTAVEPGQSAVYDWANIGVYGNRSLSISNPTGWAIAYNDQLIPYDAGDHFVVSGFIKTENVTGGALVKVDFLDASYNWLGQKISFALTGTQDWTRVQAVIESAPAGTSFLRVAASVNAGTGTAYFDALQLERGTVVSAYNLVENSSFERDANGDGIPDYWTTSGNLGPDDRLVQNVAPEDDNVFVGENAFRLTGQAGVNKYIRQRIPFSGDATTPMTLSGWSKQVGADPNGGYYAIQVAINHTDGTVDWRFANDFDRTKDGWQHAIAEIKPTLPFDSIDVYYLFYNQTGTAYFDAMRLEVGDSVSALRYDVNGNYLIAATDPLGYTVSYTYDAAGNRTGVTDKRGNTTLVSYNLQDLPVAFQDPLGYVTQYEYNGAGQLIRVTDAKGNTRTYDYNVWNTKSRVTNALNQTTWFDYDATGNLTSITTPGGDIISHTYNDLGRAINKAYNGVTQWTLDYDADGNVIAVTNAQTGETTTFAYDRNNRLIQETEAQGQVVRYGYDPNSNLTQLSVTANGTTTSMGFEYNALDQLVRLTGNGQGRARFVYDERGNVTAVIYGNGAYTANLFNANNRLQTTRTYRPNGTLLTGESYEYDANGNRIRTVTEQGAFLYRYDKLNRLIYEERPDGTIITYDYDAVGNRTRRTETQGANTTVTDYAYDAANRLTAVDGQALAYDANGNLVSNGAYTYVYNPEHHLIAVRNTAGQNVATYTYNYRGQRTSMSTPDGTVHFLYNGNNVVMETDDAGNILAEYTWDAQGNPVTLTRQGITYSYHLNGHGDVVALTDPDGNVVAEYTYDAWGNVLSQSGPLAAVNPHRYAGYRFDEATGLYYLNARYYNAGTGTFLSLDPEDGDVNDPQTQNGYTYANNNPLGMIDPDGRIALPIHGNWCGPGHGGGIAKDRLDACCRTHDKCYGARKYFACSCDRNIVYCINANYSRMKWRERIKAKLVRTYFTVTWCNKFY